MRAGACPWSFLQGQMGHTVLAAETPALPGSPDPHESSHLAHSSHFWQVLGLPCTCHRGCRNNPINSGLVFARNEAWGMVSAAKQLSLDAVALLLKQPPVPSPFTQGIDKKGGSGGHFWK